MTIGSFGHLSVIISFVTALVATFAYFRAATNPLDENTWKTLARRSFYVHVVAIFSVVGTLFYLIANHRFDYYYAYDNSSLSLPKQYLISCFWQDQEGSFLLWMFWQAIIGVILIKTNKQWEAPMMVVYALVQTFLTSMILGVIIPGLDFKIGSTPFLTLKEAMPDIPVWAMQPDFVPKDGKGLNPLLQNYWMVIHPPTLFLGFALTLVPFAYLMAGLWQKQVTEWIRPALPWALLAACVLGVGILMGAYWAYETLSFNSYWSWDPVENAVYVPWVVLVAGLHTMLTARKNSTSLKASVILIITQFVLILYSTFLTRSGILGNASVHSFTDLGLSGQLLLYLLAFIAVAIILSVRAWKLMPSDEAETSVYSREFWLFMGATALCLASFQVILPTSIPVWNKIVEALGGTSKLAPPANSMVYYSNFQLWFYSVIIALTGIGQYFWWKKVGENKLQALFNPLIITLFISALLFVVLGVNKIPYMVLLTTAVFGLVANLTIIFGIIKGNYRVTGGAITHVGVALMLIGILFSSGYQKVVSMNNTGIAIASNIDFFTKDDNKENKENVMLWYGKPTRMGDYMLTYKGPRIQIRDMKQYIPWTDVQVIEGDFKAICLKDITVNSETYHKKGDTVAVYSENVYYEVEYLAANGSMTTLYPRAQMNEQMGTVISPDVKHELNKDLYSFVNEVADPRVEAEWSAAEKMKVMIGDTFFVNDYVAILDNVTKTDKIEGITLTPNDIAVKAQIRVFDKEQPFTIEPTYAINQDRMVMRKPETNDQLGLRMQLMEIDPQTGTFSFDVTRKQRDYIVIKVVEKPLINLLWIGTLILVIGFLMATTRRFREFAKMRDKALA
jgi:cytochrome c-type biogenesis protein CcmF